MTPEAHYLALSEEEITGLLWVACDPAAGFSAAQRLPAARALLAQGLIERATVQGAQRYVLGPRAQAVLAAREQLRARAQAELNIPVQPISIAEDLEGTGIRVFRGDPPRDSFLLQPFPDDDGDRAKDDDDLERQDAPGEGGFAAAPCCACGVVGSHRNILQLGVRAPLPGRGWGCVVCDLPTDGAVAVVCDACVEQRRPPTHACAGWLTAPERVPIESLTQPFDHRTPHD